MKNNNEANHGDKPISIGVLVRNRKRVCNYRPPFDKRRFNSGEISAVYFFSPADIDLNRAKIKGAMFDFNRGTWVNRLFPFPDVLYLNGGMQQVNSYKLELLKKMVLANKVLATSRMLELDKWKVYRRLSADADLKEHLPETRLNRRFKDDIRPVVHKYGGAYLKARRGRRGLQVMQISLLPGGNFEYTMLANNLISGKIDNLAGLHQVVNSFFGGRNFIIQQPIDLIRYRGNIVDLRAEMQRNGRGDLEVLAIPVRVAREKAPITTHAASFQFEPFFEQKLGYSKEELSRLKKRLYDLLFKVYFRMEEWYGPLGELGIDIGLDNKGRLWIIECNPLSAKVSLRNAYDRKTFYRSLINPLEYAVFAAGRRAGI